MTEIIVLSGYARSGKNTAADVLSREFGFKQIAFADKLREVLYQLNPLVNTDRGYTGPNVYVQDVIAEYGWEGCKETPFGKEIRRLLQRLGTEAGRDVLGQNVWVNAAISESGKYDRVVIPDGRFINELDAVVNSGGYAWRIERKGVSPLNDHISETQAESYDKFSLYLHNNGTQEEFESLVADEYRRGRYTEWNYS